MCMYMQVCVCIYIYMYFVKTKVKPLADNWTMGYCEKWEIRVVVATTGQRVHYAALTKTMRAHMVQSNESPCFCG